MNESASNDDFNTDELVAPEWLNEQFVTEVLSNHEMRINMLTFSPASAKGDHYASVMFRAKVEYTMRKGAGASSKSLIIKTMPEQEGHKKEMFAESFLFKTEIGMYSTVLPEFERILRQAGDDTNLHGECIFLSLEPRQVMIFKDLVEIGYFMNPDFLKDYTLGLFGLRAMMEDPIMTSGMAPFIELLGKVPELNKYKPYFEKIKGNYLQRVRDIMEEHRENQRPDGYYVLSHGDFHLRNMMFKNNDKTGAFEDYFFSISTTLPFIWALKIKAFEIEDLIKQKQLRAKCYSIGGFIADVTRMLERFDRWATLKNYEQSIDLL
ncbi:uncharacterized protein LOC108153890 [Drosophila miranda]|uniref:uncharacterized protein LOC108153890 n=1 Tax=Drosophila miranda TaxID=7229 RepID=UPI00143F711B|nr:uncharacterized protein LOC108153890 [Drosophila miranda]